jgi:hypothetical protein
MPEIPPHRIRAKRTVSVLWQRHDSFTSGLKQHMEDVKNVSKTALSGNYSATEWVADVSALWINGASLVASAFFGVPLASEGADENAGEPKPGRTPTPAQPPRTK